jgi:hypothetical protein
MNESKVYDRGGLFHNIVKQSATMNGNYHVLSSGSADLNSNTLSGIAIPSEKYPLVACLPPVSALSPTVSQGQWEYFSFRLLFLCSSEKEDKLRNTSTNSATRTAPVDWSNMKEAALSFMNALEQIQDKMRGKFQLDDRTQWKINRLFKIQNDQVSGVILSFTGMVAAACNFPDITQEAINLIQIPE